MQNFQNSFETRKRSSYSAFSICMTVPLIRPSSTVNLKFLRKMIDAVFTEKAFLVKWKNYAFKKNEFPRKTFPQKFVE